MGRRGRFWEGRLNMFKRGVYSGREGYILGGSHAHMFKGGYILGCRGRFCEGRLYRPMFKGGIFWEYVIYLIIFYLVVL